MKTSELFSLLVEQSFEKIHVKNQELSVYTAGILEKFVLTERLFKPLYEFGDSFYTQYISNMIERSMTTNREESATIHKHIGDFSMFIIGLFRESAERKGLTNLYMTYGKRSYSRVSDYQKSRSLATLFMLLSREFERCVEALNYMREHYIKLERIEDWEYRFLLNP